MSNVSPEWRRVAPNEFFYFGPYGFDVNKAKDILKAKKKPRVQVLEIDTPEINTLLKLIDFSTPPVEDVDLSAPVILAQIKICGQRQVFPIDGYKRIQCAKDMKGTALPCVVLSLKDTRAILVELE